VRGKKPRRGKAAIYFEEEGGVTSVSEEKNSKLGAEDKPPFGNPQSEPNQRRLIKPIVSVKKGQAPHHREPGEGGGGSFLRNAESRLNGRQSGTKRENRLLGRVTKNANREKKKDVRADRR